ncbi:glycosyltransferase family 4 protein [Vicingus serpentipes]|uniref:Glycosyltransferase family 4 protein n=1 Tax=Vicingus serpentipes TaxID=1926625 RepID=A0A5C6RZA5_9FLAO|nr:glycosyltransferase [Vicingus serpentipes]TXB67285.1 glycosyltransferase family 4 protein [Vicingus serpentipes]
MPKQQKIIISVTNDLVVDQRVAKICQTLSEMGYKIVLVGRELKGSLPVARDYNVKRFKLFFNKGFLFYANYNIRLFFYLLYSNVDILWSNDLDTLPANYLASKVKGKKIVYDSHEFFTEVPELVKRPKVQKVWETIEELILPKLKNVITVCNSIAKCYEEKYNIKVNVVRNVPRKNKTFLTVKNLREGDKNIIIYQGSVNINRGLEALVKAMQEIDNTILYIIGDGDVFENIISLILELNLNHKVKMLGKIHFELLHDYTMQADLGLSLEENVGLNYKYALPNKLFDYINAKVPVLTSNLPEMAKIVNQYQVGETIDEITPNAIAKKINQLFENSEQLKSYKTNTIKAAEELNWESEQKIIQGLVKEIK